MSNAFISSLSSALTGLVTSANLSAAVSAVAGVVSSSGELKTDATKIMAVVNDPAAVASICDDMLKVSGDTPGEVAAIEAVKSAVGPSAILNAVIALETVIADS